MIEIQRNEVHLWLVYDPQVKDENLLASYQALLNQDEKKRHSRFVFAKHRHQFLVTRALVRSVLAQYLPDGDPQTLEFARNAFGKPRLRHSDSAFPITFNLSHTDGLIVLAVGLDNELGVDVEYFSRQVDILSLAERYFSAEEAADLLGLDVEQLNERFFDLWTLKESYIKACGMGLAIPLKDFGFRFEGSEISISFAAQREDSPDKWGFWQLEVEGGYRLSLAVSAESGCQAHKIVCRSGIPLQGFAEMPTIIARSS